ncbi:MAG: hypothetical protein ABFD75_00690 [Smithella sp.]
MAIELPGGKGKWPVDAAALFYVAERIISSNDRRLIVDIPGYNIVDRLCYSPS